MATKNGFKVSIKTPKDVLNRVDLLGRLKYEAEKRSCALVRGVEEIKLLDPKKTIFVGDEYKLKLKKTVRTSFDVELLRSMVPAKVLRECTVRTSYITADFTPISSAAKRMAAQLSAVKKENRLIKKARKTK